MKHFRERKKMGKRNSILRVYALLLCLISSHIIIAQHSWAIVTIKEGQRTPLVTEYHCYPENRDKGDAIQRIYSESSLTRSEPVKSNYGYRLEDKHIYLYDFVSGKEHLAFDFTLSVGNRFRTYNGIEWIVDSVKDTLVNVTCLGKNVPAQKRLMKVHSADALYYDSWLEDFGSFTNHFMILPMTSNQYSHTLWMEYDYGNYIVREISANPLFTYDSGYAKGEERKKNEKEAIKSEYKNGTLTVEKIGWHSPNREYSCFYRIDNNIYRICGWELNPGTEADCVIWKRDTICYTGLSDLKDKEYTVHFNTKDFPLGGISEVVSTTICKKTDNSFIYDLQGRKHQNVPKDGIFIIEGKKKITIRR